MVNPAAIEDAAEMRMIRDNLMQSRFDAQVGAGDWMSPILRLLI